MEQLDPKKLTSEQGCDLVGECLDQFEIVSNQIIGHRRWSVDHELVFKDTVTGKFYQTYYSVGATESQCESPFEYEAPQVTEVRRVEKMIPVVTYEEVT